MGVTSLSSIPKFQPNHVKTKPTVEKLTNKARPLILVTHEAEVGFQDCLYYREPAQTAWAM